MVKDLTCQEEKELKILLQKIVCLVHGCRGRFSWVGTTALDWKCNVGIKNACHNPLVWEFFALACFGQNVLDTRCRILRLSHAQICRNWVHNLREQSQNRVISTRVCICCNRQLLQKLSSRYFPPLLKQNLLYWVVGSPHLCTSTGLRAKPRLCFFRLKPHIVASASSWV